MTQLGLDFFDVAFRIEKQFGIKISQDDLLTISRDNDVRAGDLYDLMLRKLNLQDNTRNSVGLNLFLWRQLQEIVADVVDKPHDEVMLQSPMEQLFPANHRRHQWDELRDASPYHIRELDYSPFVRLVALALTSFVVYVEWGQLWQIPIMNGLLPVLGLLGIWIFAETYLKMLGFLAPWRNSIPKQLTTMKELCRDVLASNYEDVCQDAEMNPEIDSRCHAVWLHLVEILCESLGVDPDEITFQSRLIRDLDMA